jgi:CheY-like chemotaxis protein
MLERHGYHVLEARHGADALQRFRARRDEIAAIVTDIRMPEMGGIEFVRRLRAEAPRVPVVFASGYADTAHVVADPQLERFVPKPFHAEQLLRALHEVRAAAFAG